MNYLPITQDIEGRIENLNWKPSTQWAMPILEAISNSLHATQSLEPSKRSIKVTLITEGDDQQNIITDKQRERPIIGFRIEDNGVGFDEENFDAFTKLDTRHKKAFGGKGIGRLFWLKAFSHVNIKSTYRQNGHHISRDINFAVNGISSTTPVVDIASDNKTIVEVTGLKAPYKKYYHKLANTLAKEIAEEFLPYFILNGWPETMTVSFTDVGEGIISVKDVTQYDSSMENFRIKEHDFTIIHVLDYQGDRHKTYFCASDRIVYGYKSEAATFLPKRQITSPDGKPYWYLGLISSPYLTHNVSSERDIFLTPEKKPLQQQLDQSKDLSLEEIEEITKIRISYFLQESLINAQSETVKSINKVLESNPELKVVSFSEEEIKSLISSTENDIKKTFRNKLNEQLDHSQLEINALIARIGTEDCIDFKKFKMEFDEEVRRFSLLNQSHIVSYVLYRKHVLALFEKALTVFSGEKAAKESFIHNLIFPMGEQGKPSDFGTNHNLWLIDDRLSMVEWIASDVSLSRHSILQDSDSKKEPDLVFL